MVFPLAPDDNSLSVNDEKIAILVAGITFPHAPANLDPAYRTYLNYCLNYKTYLLAHKIVDRVFVFDFSKGEKRSFESGGPANGRLEHDYGPLKMKNFRYDTDDGRLTIKRNVNRRHYVTSIDELATQQSNDPDADVLDVDYRTWAAGLSHWRPGTETTLSISHVYAMLRDPLHRSKVSELHFFSHGFNDGPILVNTDQHGDSKLYDKDPRKSDFTNPELESVFGITAIVDTRSSFANEPVVGIWGCNGASVHSLFDRIRAKEAKNEPFEHELGQLRARMANTFAQQLATTLGRPVIGALPGTGSAHEGEANNDTSGWTFSPTAMHVNFSLFESDLASYKKYLNVRFATTGPFAGHPIYGRGYGILSHERSGGGGPAGIGQLPSAACEERTMIMTEHSAARRMKLSSPFARQEYLVLAMVAISQAHCRKKVDPPHSDAVARGSTAPQQETPRSAAATPVPPPRGPVALGEPRAFHFVVPLAGYPQAVVALPDTVNLDDANRWKADTNLIRNDHTNSPRWEQEYGRSAITGILADEAKIPSPLRLRGVSIHLYGDQKFFCDGTLTVPRIGTIGGFDWAPVLLYEIDLEPDCRRRFLDAWWVGDSHPSRQGGVAVGWARDASLTKPVIVGRSQSADDPAVHQYVQAAMKLVRGRPSMMYAQREIDHLVGFSIPKSFPVETYGFATWTRFKWNGETRGYFALVTGCTEGPDLRVGFDFREHPDGSLELLRDRWAQSLSDSKELEPLVVLDVDGDGELEVIESGTQLRLSSFETAKRYVEINQNSCGKW